MTTEPTLTERERRQLIKDLGTAACVAEAVAQPNSPALRDLAGNLRYWASRIALPTRDTGEPG